MRFVVFLITFNTLLLTAVYYPQKNTQCKNSHCVWVFTMPTSTTVKRESVPLVWFFECVVILGYYGGIWISIYLLLVLDQMVL